MSRKRKSLAENIAEDIFTMITIDKKFVKGDKLPNENELSAKLNVSRTTLREAIRILVAHDILEIKRGKGTYVKNDEIQQDEFGLKELSKVKLDIKDLYEMRLIFEPQAAYYAAKRATDKELERIMYYGKLVEEKLMNNEDRTELELAFHKSIAKATHNEFMNRLVPILYQAINKGVVLSNVNEEILTNTLNDHRMIMDFLAARNPEGAKTAMKLHILHAMAGFGISED